MCHAFSKAQAQMLMVAGLHFGNQLCFSHGQLHMDCSRVGDATQKKKKEEKKRKRRRKKRSQENCISQSIVLKAVLKIFKKNFFKNSL